MLNWLESKCIDIFIVKKPVIYVVSDIIWIPTVFLEYYFSFALYLFKTVPLLEGAINSYLDKRSEFSKY